MAKNLLLTNKYIVIGGDFEHGGEASSKIKNELKRLGISSDIIRNISIASYEAEMNIIIYAKDGTMTLEVYSNKIKIIAEDIGPGTSDIELAMEEGYSTAPPEVIEMGFGAGIPLLKQMCILCGGQFTIKSRKGKDTKIIAQFEKNSIDLPPMDDIETTILILLLSCENTDIKFAYTTDGKIFEISSKGLKKILGEILFSNPEVIKFLKKCIKEKIKVEV